MVSLLNLNIGDTIKAYTIDFLMKLIYYLYATLAAGVDAMQKLVRQLCGLENYVVDSGGGTTIATNGDPLSNFILGVLGIGENSEVYSALNTVFWSLAVFALIILSITTMVAMVKAHYNEDSQQTNPWTYIYTAGKAIFTFALIPIVTLIGFQLSSFILRTLDNITAGAGSEGQVVELYGTGGASLLKSSTDSQGKTSYANYDMFGNLSPTSTTTFSGMLFNASMYGANRLRNGQVDLKQVTGTFNNLFGNGSCSAYQSLTNDNDRRAYVARQVDYAFANSLALDGNTYSWNSLVDTFEDSFIIGKLDPFHQSNINGFYKFYASVIWAYYDLMQFNFIVGFAGVFTTFGIMLSIVLALVSRLIKGVALFLVYPTLLGIAPMDNFKAFKSWGTNFMQQIMMAFGTIVGINLLLLILPYVQNFKFFDFDVLNYMMNVIMLVVGLVMAKDFMSMISGFVGGADANQLGEGMKGEVGNKIKSGVTAPARLAGGAARIGLSAATAPIRMGKKVAGKAKKVATLTSAARANRQASRAQKLIKKMENTSADPADVNTRKLDAAQRKLGNARSKADAANASYKQAAHDLHSNRTSRGIAKSKMLKILGNGDMDDMFSDQEKSDMQGLVQQELRNEGISTSAEEYLQKYNEKLAMKQFEAIVNNGYTGNNENLKALSAKYNEKTANISKLEKTVSKRKDKLANANQAQENAENKYSAENQKVAEARVTAAETAAKEAEEKKAALGVQSQKAQIKAEKIAGKYGLVGNSTGTFDFKDGQKPKLFEGNGFFKQLGQKINEGIDGMTLGRTIADSFVKTIDGVGSGLGLDKVIKAATDEMGKSFTFKGGPFKPSVSGDALQKKQHAELMKQDKEQTTALNDIRKAIEELRKDTNKNAQEAKNNNSSNPNP